MHFQQYDFLSDYSAFSGNVVSAKTKAPKVTRRKRVSSMKYARQIYEIAFTSSFYGVRSLKCLLAHVIFHFQNINFESFVVPSHPWGNIEKTTSIRIHCYKFHLYWWHKILLWKLITFLCVKKNLSKVKATISQFFAIFQPLCIENALKMRKCLLVRD